MTIRNKILLYFSASTIGLCALTFALVYVLFSNYREEVFQQKQKQKIFATIKLFDQYKQQTEELSFILDAQDIHDFYDEKLIIFDSDKELVFSSLDNLKIEKSKKILLELSPAKTWIETTENNYDVVGVYVERHNKGYYAISKAYDVFGYDKLYFLRNSLSLVFLVICIIIVVLSFYLANNLSKPINKLAARLKLYDLNKEDNLLMEQKTSTKEIQYLTQHFNELLLSTREAFTFQKNTVQHISHQLKTPVAILVSELEKMQQVDDLHLLKQDLSKQTLLAKSLGDIISTLLEIARIESGSTFKKQIIRVDEILFDLMDHFKILFPEFNFVLHFKPEAFSEAQMEILGNDLLIQQALENLLHNSIIYGNKTQATITLNTSDTKMLHIIIANEGTLIDKEDQKYLFHYFFRGKNNQNTTGNGLGLVLTQKIVQQHHGKIRYYSEDSFNVFELQFPYITSRF